MRARAFCKKILPYSNSVYWIDTSILLEYTPVVKFIRNYVLDTSVVKHCIYHGYSKITY